MTAEASQFKVELKTTKKDIADLGKGASDSALSFTKLNTALSNVGASGKQVAKINEALRQANPELLRKGIAEVTKELKNLGATEAEIAKITRELEDSAKGASGLNKEVKTLGAAYAGLAVAMTAVIAKAIETSRTFEQSMANVKAISQATGSEFESLRDQAIALGSSTVFSASQAADAQALLAQAGFRTNDILSAMPGLLDLAAAGQTDLATTADIAASALNGFGLAAEESGRVADVLAKSSIDTNADITDLGMAMKYIAPVAASMGVSIEEATAAVGELSNAGIKGEMAGTQLRAILLALASPTQEAASYMQQLGVSIQDASGHILPLGSIVGQLQGAFARLTEAQQADVAATLVGREAASGFITLIKNGKTTLDNYTSSLQNAGGTAQQVAEVQMDTLNGAINELQSALEGAGITVGDMFAPAIRDVAETITRALIGFNDLNPALQAAIVALPAATVGALGLAAAIGAVAIALKGLQISFPIIGAVSLAIGALVAGISAIASWSNQAAESVRKHDEAQKSLNETLNQSPLNRSVAELEELQKKTEELNGVLHERALLQERLNEMEALAEKGQGTPEMLSEAMDINDELEKMDKKLREMGYDGVEDATAKLAEMKKAAENSTTALFEMRKEEINDLATKKQTLDSVDKLVAKYHELNSKQELDTAQKQELIATVNALKREYPDLNAIMDEEGRIRGQNIDLIETQIQKDRDFINQSVQSQKTYIQNLITTTEQQRKSVEAQIKNYEKLLGAMNALNGARNISEGKGPVKSGVSDALKKANPSVSNFLTDTESKQSKLNDLYAEQNAFAEQEREMQRALNSLTSGDFSDSSIKNGINLTKPGKEKKEQAGKTAAELRKDAYDAAIATVQYQSEMYDWTADQQIKAYEKVRKQHQKHLKESIEDERQMNLQLKRLQEDSVKSRYDFSAEWIDREERRMEESGKSESEIAQMKIDAWTRVRDRYAKDSENYKQADEELYRAKKELIKLQEDAEKEAAKAREERVKEYQKQNDDLVKSELKAIEKAKQADLDAIDKRRQEYLDAQNEKIAAIDELLKKEEELNADADYETQLAEKKARQALLSTAVSPEGRKELADITAEIERMQLEHSRELRKRDLEDQKDKLEDEKDEKEKAYDEEKRLTEARYDALTEALEEHQDDIEFIESAIKDFRISSNKEANDQILSDLDQFVSEYRSRMAEITSLSSAASAGGSIGGGSSFSQAELDLAEYNANKDDWDAAKARGDKEEMARLSARNEEIRRIYGIEKDTGKLDRLPSFDVGGVIPGPAGTPVPIVAHGGEIYLNPEQQANLFRMLDAPRTPPADRAPAAPQQIIHNTFDMSVGTVEVNDQTDAEILYTERERAARRLATTGGGK